jgi:hypothetical protein
MTTTTTTIQWDYSIEDAKDDAGVDENNIVGDDEDIWKYLDNNNIPQESLGYGYGWFDKEMASLGQSVDLSIGKFSSEPPPYDRWPTDIPANHPIRAIAQVLHQALPNSLSDRFALDLITHHGGDKTIKIILQPCEQSVARIKEFLKRFERVNSYDVFYSRVELRIAIANTSKRGCTQYSSMHDKRLMTNEHCLYVSYNLTPVARCANWEAMVLTDTLQQEINAFDSHWESLQGREIEEIYPNFYPETFTVPKRRRVR